MSCHRGGSGRPLRPISEVAIGPEKFAAPLELQTAPVEAQRETSDGSLRGPQQAITEPWHSFGLLPILTVATSAAALSLRRRLDPGRCHGRNQASRHHPRPAAAFTACCTQTSCFQDRHRHKLSDLLGGCPCDMRLQTLCPTASASGSALSFSTPPRRREPPPPAPPRGVAGAAEALPAFVGPPPPVRCTCCVHEAARCC